MSKVIVVAGTTASGKTSLALRLAKKFDSYIINADSRQIYKELKIGTSQPKPDRSNDDGSWDIGGVKHFLFGFLSVTETYNIHRYKEDVKKVMSKEDGVPILVGGTGLYIDSVVFNYDLDKSSKNSPMDSLYMFLEVSKEELDERIKERIDEMFKNGLVSEVEALWKNFPKFELKALKSIGYAEFKEHFEGRLSVDEIKHRIFLHTRQYAKRQRTWFRRNKNVVYIKNYKEAELLVEDFLNN